MILHTRGRAAGFSVNVIGKVALSRIQNPAERQGRILIDLEPETLDPDSYAGVITDRNLDQPVLDELARRVPLVHSVAHLNAFAQGQVVLMNGVTGFVRILFRPESRFNYMLVTEQCNSRCLMCSQPPRQIDDRFRIAENLRLIELIDSKAEFLGITGGEPTLLKEGLLVLIRKCRDYLPSTHIHMLTNGRLFRYEEFARKLTEVGHPNLMLGIPLYSDVDHEHDYVVQAKGAFNQTAVGLHNLGRYGQSIEIRVVIHALTYRRLPSLAGFIYRNFPFVSHVALMGLEITGYTKPNLGALWVDPFDYQDELEEATNILANRGMRVSIYNHQLCVLRESLWPFSRKAISDWKNEYIDTCDECDLRASCGGFFTSTVRLHSTHVRALKAR